MEHQSVIAQTRRWIEEMVIGLNLCPFAWRVFQEEKIRYVLTEAEDEERLLRTLTAELHHLAATPISAIETTLLIHPQAFPDFLDYNDFVGAAEERLESLGLSGTIQIAGFHPQYQFADTDPDAVENYTNRSPYPMLHLLREESITAVADNEEMLLEIPQRNIETLRALGRDTILAKLRAIKDLPGTE